MNQKITEVIRRSETSTEYYGEDWSDKNIKIVQESWSGPAPFSTSLWPRYCSEIKRYGGAWFHFQNAADMTFEILLDGTLNYTQDGITETVHPGELYIMHEGADIVFNASPGDYFHRLRMTLYGSMVRNLDQEFHLTGRRVISLREPERFCGYFRRLFELLAERNGEKAPEISAFAYRIIAELAAESSSPASLPELLAEVLGTMKNDLGRNFSIQELAERRKIGVHTLMRLFRKHLGMSPREYLIHLRMESAKHLVGSSALSMKEIAERLGYCNSLYFSTAFRKAFRMTPSKYRSQKKMLVRE